MTAENKETLYEEIQRKMRKLRDEKIIYIPPGLWAKMKKSIEDIKKPAAPEQKNNIDIK